MASSKFWSFKQEGSVDGSAGQNAQSAEDEI